MLVAHEDEPARRTRLGGGPSWEFVAMQEKMRPDARLGRERQRDLAFAQQDSERAVVVPGDELQADLQLAAEAAQLLADRLQRHGAMDNVAEDHDLPRLVF